MRIMHISDLHLGRALHGCDLIEDQIDAVKQVVEHVKSVPHDAVLIAGDVYDRSLPPVEAVSLFSDFLGELAELGLQVVVIPGNHDSPERLGFADAILEKAGIHVRSAYDRLDRPVTIKGRDGMEIDVFAMPFLEPALVENALRGGGRQAPIKTAPDAAAAAVEIMSRARRQGVPAILVAHEFVGAGSLTSESERMFIGGAHILKEELFKDFDYVALGHLHRPQKVGSDRIRYSGSLLPYSFSEADHQKSVVSLTFNRGAASPVIEEMPVKPRHPLRVVKDTYDNIIAKDEYATYKDCRVCACVTDSQYHVNMLSSLRERFPLLANVRQLPLEASDREVAVEAGGPASSSPEELFRLFLKEIKWEDEGDMERAVEIFLKAFGDDGERKSEVAS